MTESALIIPYQQLQADTLHALIESFIMREGTDYGEHEYSLQDKVAQVLTQLHAGKAHIVFDPVTETPTLLMKELLHGQA